MGQNYPSFPPSYSHEDLVEHFLLTPGELDLGPEVPRRRESLRYGAPLKTLPHLGYVPDRLDDIPPDVREFIAGQIHGAYQAHTDELLLASACARLRSLRIELPAKGEPQDRGRCAGGGAYPDR